MESSLKEWIISSFKSINNKEFLNTKEVIDVETKSLTDQTNICASDIFRITIKLMGNNGEIKYVKAVYKKDPTKPGFDQMSQELSLGDNEEMVYNKILKPIEENILSDEQDYLWPQCYLSKDRNLLLEDLCEHNFKVVPTSNLLNISHAMFAVKAIAKYHGLGLILKERGLIDVTTLPKNIYLTKSKIMRQLFKGSLTQLAEITEKDWEPEWHQFGEKLRKSAENIEQYMYDLVISTQDKFSVICHGDYNIRNIIYQYHDVQNQEEPIGVKLIDFQLPNWSNFGFDFAYLVSSSMLPQTREENFDKMITAYSSNLSETCLKYGYSGYIPTIDDLRQNLNCFQYFMAIFNLVAIPVLMAADKYKMSSLLDESENTFQSDLFNYKPVKEALQYQLKLASQSKLL